jgi:competence protein ComEC
MSRKEIFVIIFLLTVAFVRFKFFLPTPLDYSNAVGKKVALEGTVVEDPDVRLSTVRLTVKPKNQESNVLVVVPSGTEVAYGDVVKVSGMLETPENFITNSGKEFNYGRYLANQDIYFIIKNAQVEVISSGHGFTIQAVLYRLRNSFMRNIGNVISPPESDLADGLILGARGGFDNDMRNEFVSTGTIHIIALSGYNVTIVATGIMKVLGLILSQTLSIIFGIFVIILFIMLAGASSTAIRAGIMAVIALFARMTGRNYDAGRALVIAALVMVAYDVRVLTDISFQLSFIATFGVLFITPLVIKWVRFFPMRFGLRELVATTIAATISVLPILLYSTGILSLVSLPANILILPFIPITMFLSFVVGMFGFVSYFLSVPFAYLAHILLHYILAVIHFFASLPFVSITIQSFPLWLAIVLYVAILWWVFGKNKKSAPEVFQVRSGESI